MTTPTPHPILCLRRILPATPQEVFDAWTDPESLGEWLCPGAMVLAEVRLDVRVGGQFSFVMKGANGDLLHTGEYREIQSPRKLVFTWRSAGTYGKDTLVTVEFHPHEGETELVLTHEWLPDETAAESHTQGWRSVVDKLHTYLSR